MPARCPSCNQTYTDETLTFCPNDGTPLVREVPPPYDPQGAMYGAGGQPPGNYPPPQPPPQQGYYPGAPQQPPPGGQAPPPPPPGWQPPYGQQQHQQYPPPYGAPVAGAGKSKMPLILGLLALVLIGGGVGLYFLLRDNNSSTTNTTNTTPTSSPAATRSPGSTTTSTFPTPSTTGTTTTTSGSYTDDEKHRLFQTVGRTGDNALILEVAQKIGIVEANGQPNNQFQPFITEHLEWQKRNRAWAQEYFDPQKAREYVMAHK